MGTPNPPSAIRSRAVDPPLAQDAGFKDNEAYRAYVDDQIRGLQLLAVQGGPLTFVSTLSMFPPSASTRRQVVQVDGYAESGDGGGGVFVWNPTDTRADDGGTIIAVNGFGVGRWNRVFDGPLNPQWWGADPTGTVVSTTAFLDAIAATQARGGVLEFTGYFVVDAELDFGDGIQVRGAGWRFSGLGSWTSPSGCSGSFIASTVTSGKAVTIGTSKLDGVAIVQPNCTFGVGGAPIPATTATGLSVPGGGTIGTQVTNVFVGGFAVGWNPGGLQEGLCLALKCWSNTIGMVADGGPVDVTYYRCDFNANRTNIMLVSCSEQHFVGGLNQSGFDRGVWTRPLPDVTLCSFDGVHFENNNSAGNTSDASGTATTIAAGSDGVALPQAMIHVVATAGITSPVTVMTDSGPQSVAFTGTSGGNTLTGCTGGAGTMHTGNTVSHGAAYGDFVFDLTCEKAAVVNEIDHFAVRNCSVNGSTGVVGPVPIAFLRNTSGTNGSSYINFAFEDNYAVGASLSLPSWSLLSSVKNNQLGGTFVDAGQSTRQIGSRDGAVGLLPTRIGAVFDAVLEAAHFVFTLASGKTFAFDTTGGVANAVGHAGALNIPNNTGLYGRNHASNGDRRLVSNDTSDVVQVGDDSAGGMTLHAGTGDMTQNATLGSFTFNFGSGKNFTAVFGSEGFQYLQGVGFKLLSSLLYFGRGSNATIQCEGQNADVAAGILSVLAGAAWSSASSNKNGGDLDIGGGAAAAGGTNGMLNVQNPTTGTSSPSPGGAGALPATPLGYLSIKIAGTTRQIPFY